MKANIAIQILPQTLDEDEVVRIVDAVIDYIRSTGLSYYVGPCETAIEGDNFEELMEIATKCTQIAVETGSVPVASYIKTSYKPDGSSLTIEKKTSKHHQ